MPCRGARLRGLGARRPAGRLLAALAIVLLAVLVAGSTASGSRVEQFQTWAPTMAGVWETKNLGSAFGVPAKAVVEIAISNSDSGAAQTGGVRAVGSALNRSFSINKQQKGTESVEMLVQADASGQIQTFASSTTNINYTVLGYWTNGAYVETMGSFTVSSAATWQSRSLSGMGIGPNQVAEIVITNDSNNSPQVGVRTEGSSLSRIIDVRNLAGGSGPQTITMLAKTGSTGAANIQAYSELTANVSFNVVGYWSTAPGNYVEAFANIGAPSANSTWQSVNLGTYGVTANSVADVIFTNEETNTTNSAGVRDVGSANNRVLALNSYGAGATGGPDNARMFAKASNDANATIQYYHGNRTMANFYLLGYFASNAAPVNSLPPSQATPLNTPLTLSGALAPSVSDTDSDPLEVKLAATGGTVTLSGTAGLSFSGGTGTGDATMMFVGRIANINAALNGLVFTPTTNYSGPASLTMATGDLGGQPTGVASVLPSTSAAAQFDKQQVATSVSFATAGTVANLNVYLDLTKASDVRLGLYSNVGGEPAALLAEMNATLPIGSDWFSFDIPDVAVSAGTYWLAVAPAKEGALHYSATGGNTRFSNYDPKLGLASPWSGTYSTNTWRISAFAGFTPTGNAAQIDTDVLAITVGPNTAPTLDATKSPVLAPVGEDAAAPVGAVGTLVSSLVDFASPSGQVDNVTDPDGGALLGIAVTAVDNSNGIWSYSTDGGSTWSALGAVGNASARLLAADAGTRLHFQPNANFNGTLAGAITFRAWDRTSGANGALVDTSANGGATAFSTSTDTARLTVTAVNDAPVLDNSGSMSLPNGLQDTADPAGMTVPALIASAGGDRITDVDPGAVEGIAITAAGSAIGAWQYSTDAGANWYAVGNVGSNKALVLGATANDLIRFLPVAGVSGAATFSFRAWDRSDALPSGTAAVDTNTNGGTSPFSTAVQVATIYVEPLQVLLWMSTSGDVSGSGVPGLPSWTQSTVLTFGDPGLSLGANATGGRFSTLTNFDTFGTDVDITGLHRVNQAVTLTGPAISGGSVSLVKGDMLFVTPAAESLSTAAGSPPAGWSSSISVAAGSIYAFRPVSGGNYGSGYFRLVTVGPGINPTREIGLVEAPTTVGGTALAAGDLLFTQAGTLQQNNIYWYHTAGNTSSLLIDGSQVGIPGGGAGAGIDSLGVVQGTFTTGGFTFQTGDVLVGFNKQVDGVGGGASTLTALPQDIVRLRFTATTYGAGTAVATAATLFDGDSKAKFDAAAENVDAVGLLVQSAGGNVPPTVTLPGATLAYTEGAGAVIVDSTATVSDLDSPDLDTGVLLVDFDGTGTPNDRLAIRNQGLGAGQIGVAGSNVTYGGVVIGTFGGGTDGSTPLVVTLNSFATPSSAQALVRNLTYANVSNNPSAAPRVLRVLLSDGDGATSAAAKKAINVTNVNDPPVAVNDAYATNEDTSLVVAPSTGGLQNWWGFDEGSPSQATGSAGSLGSSGTLGSSAGVDAADPTWTAGYLGGHGLSFDGAGDYVQTTSTDLKTASSFTLSAWFKTTTTTSTQHLLWQGYAGGNGYGNGGSTTPATSEMSLSVGGYTAAYNNKIVFSLGYDIPANGADSIFIVSASDFTDTTAWHHVAVSVADIGGGVMRASLYVDGRLEGTDTGTQNDRSVWQALRIGSPGDGSRSFNGQIDEVRVYSGELSGAQILGVMQPGVLANDTDTDNTKLRVNTAVVTGPGNGTLSINADGSFTYTPNLDFNGTDSFTYRANDGTVDSNVATATITVNPVNDPPSASNLSAAETYTEDTALNLVDIVVGDVDGPTASVSLTLSSPAAGSLNTGTSGAVTSTYVPATGVWSAAGALADVNSLLAGLTFTPALDFNGSFTIATSVSDTVAPALTGSKAITGIAVNDPPSASNLSAAETYTEDTALNLVDIVVGDVDGPTASVSLTLSSPAAGSLNTGTSGAVTSTYVPATGVWSAAGALADVNSLLAGLTFTPALDFNGSFTIATSVSDTVAPALTGSKAVTGIAVNDAPTITNAATVTLAGTDEDTASSGTLVGGILASAGWADVDSGALKGIAVTGTSGNGTWQYSQDGLSWVGVGTVWATNALLLSSASQLRYLPDGVNGETAGFDFVAWDQTTGTASTNLVPRYADPSPGGGSSAYSSQAAAATITVTAVNDAPAVTGTGGTLAYTENDPAVAIDPGLTVSDVDSASLATAWVWFASGYASGQDVLGFTDQNGITGSWDSGAGMLTLSGGATVAQYQAALRSVTYANTSEAPSTSTRLMLFAVNDGVTGSNTPSRNIAVTAVDDPPVITSNGGGANAAVAVAERTTAVTTVTSSDVDGGAPTYGILPGGDGAKFAINPSTGVLAFVTPPDFENPGDVGGDNVYDLTVQVGDGNGGTDTQAIAVTVTDVADGIRVTPTSSGPLGGETLVNTETADGQAINANVAQAVATAANGDYVVVWTSNLQDGSGYGIYAQRFTADGVPQGAEFRVNATTANDQLNPSVAMDGAGNFVVTWGSNLQDDGISSGVYARRYDAAGAPQGGEFRVNTTTAGYQGGPAIAMSPAGSFVITWNSATQDPDGSSGIYGQRFDAAGAPQGGEFRVNTYTLNAQQLSWVSMDAAGNFVVTWGSNGQDGSNYGVYGQRFDAGGAPRGSEFRVNTTTANSQLYNDVAMLPDGRFVVVFQSVNGGGNLDLFLQRYAADGSPVGGEVQVNTASDPSYFPIPSVAVDPGGNILVVWNKSGDGANEGVFGRRYDWSASPLTGEFQVNATSAGRQLYPEAVAQPGGRWIVAWGGNGPGDPDGVFVQRYGLTTTEAGGTATFGVVLEAAPTADVVIPVSVPDGSEGTVPVGSLTFTTGDWSLAQTVTVTGVQDFSNDGDTVYQVLLGPATSSDPSFDGSDPGDLSVTNLEVPNLAPVNAVPGAQTVSEDATLVFSSGNGNAITISDSDAGSNDLQVTLTGSNGTITLAGTAGLTFSTGDGSADAAMTFTGAAVDVNAALAGLAFTPTADFNGAAGLQIVTDDQANTGKGGSLSDTDSVVIAVSAVNDPPVRTAGSVDNLTVAEDSGLTSLGLGGVAYGSGGGVDEAGQTLTYTVTVIPSPAFFGLIVLADGTTPVSAGSTYTLSEIRGMQFKTVPDVNGPLSFFSYQVQDSGGTANGGSDILGESIMLTVTPVNDSPVVAGVEGSALAYTENQAATAITGSLTLGDVDSASLSGATVRISGNYAPGEDLLSFADTAAITGSWVPGTGTLTLSGSDSVASYEAALRAVSYSNGSENPSTLPRTVGFTVSDGAATSNTVSRTITVTAVNDAPTATNLNAPETYTEDTALNLTDVVVGDVDSAGVTATLTLSNAAAGSLNTATSGAVTSTFVPATGVWSASGAIANVNTLLAGLTFTPAADFNGNFTIATSVSDGSLSVTGSKAISGTAVNDAPTAAIGPSGYGVNEDDGYRPLGGISVSDPDAGSNELAVTLGVGQGLIRLGTTAGLTFTVGANDSAGMTFTGTVTALNTALASVSYRPDPDYAGTDNLALSVDDQGNTGGGALSSGDSANIVVTPVNDAPVRTAGSVVDLTVLEDSGLTSLGLGGVAYGPGGGVDESGQTLSYAVTALPAGSVGNVFLVDGTTQVALGAYTLAEIRGMRFKPAANGSGVTGFQFNVTDSGGTANGGSNSISQFILITVNPVNDPPTLGATVLDPTFTEAPGLGVQAPAVGVFSGAAASTIESGQTISGLTFTVGGLVDGADEVVVVDGTTITLGSTSSGTTATNGLAFTATVSGGSATLVLSGGALSTAATQALVDGIGYQNTSADNPTSGTRAVTLTQVKDSGGTANGGADTTTLSIGSTVTVVAVNDPPTATNLSAAQSYTEDTPLALTAIVASDVDSANVAATLTLSAAGAGSLNTATSGAVTSTYDAGTGVWSASGAIANVNTLLAGLTFTPTPDFNGSFTIATSVSDGSLSVTGSKAISGSAVNDPPTLGATVLDPTFTEAPGLGVQAPAVGVFSGAAASTIESGQTISGLTFTVGGLVDGADEVVVVDGTTITLGSTSSGTTATNGLAFTATVSGGSATLVLSGGALSTAATQALVDGIGYQNTSADNPTSGTRAVTLTQVKDSGGTANGGADTTTLSIGSTVTVVAVNDPPVVTATGTALAYTENAAAMVVDPGVTVADLDSANLVSATVQISGNYAAGEDVLSFVNTATIFGSWNALNGTLTLTGSDTVANYEAALRTVRYANASESPSTALRTVGFTVSDGALNSNTANRSITVSPVNDLPVAADGSGSVAEDAASLSVDLRGLVADVETADANLSYVIVGGPAAAAGALSATGTNGVFSFVPAADFNGSASFTYRVSDRGDPDNCVAGPGCSAALASAVRTFTITVTPVNDLPVVVATPAAVSLLEDGLAVSVQVDGADVETAPANLLVTVTQVPANGTLRRGAAVLAVGSTFTGTPATLAYTPDPDFNGADQFGLKVTDTGDGAAVARDSAELLVPVSVAAVNDAPSFVAGADVVVAEDAAAQTVAGWATAISAGPANESGQALAFQVSNDNSGLFSVQPAVSAAGVLSFTPAANANGQALVSVALRDDGGTGNGGVDSSPTRTFTITVTPVNDLPVAADGSGSVAEDAASLSVDLRGLVADVETADANLSYVIVGGPAAAAGALSATGTNGVFSFVPAADFNGSASFTYRVSDRGDPDNCVAGPGCSAALASAVRTFTITVTPVNDLPVVVATPAAVSLLEDGLAVSVQVDGADVETAPANLLVTVTQVPANGTLRRGAAVLAVGSTFTGTPATLAYTPDPDFNGADQFGLKVTDTGDGAAVARDSAELLVPVSVAAVNDAPSFVAGADVVVAEDAAAQTVAGWATAISAGPANESGQALAFQVSNDNSGLFSVQPAVSAAGVLSFTPAANANGQALVSVALRDDGGTGNGGVDSSPTRTFTITVTPVNDLPVVVATPAAVSLLEDGLAVSVQVDGADVETAPANLLVTVTQVPANGTLRRGAAVLAVGSTFTGTPATLAYTPDPDFNGADQFGLKVTDTGDGAAVARDSAELLVPVSVAAVNDAPSFVAGADVVVAEDAAAQTVAGWATAISAGPANESGQALAFQVSNDNSGLFSVQPAVSAAGVLSFTPAANANGQALVSVALRDDGGTGNGGVDSSPTRTFTITVTPVNDLPVAADGSGSVAEDAASLSVDLRGLVADVETADANLSYVIVGGPAAAAGALSATGTNGVFSFVPAADFNGSASFTYRVSDRGDPDNCVAGPGCSAALASAVRTFTITVTPVNDLPVVVATPAAVSLLEDGLAVSVQVDGADVETAPANLLVTVTQVPANGTLRRGAAVLAVGSTFTGTPATLAYTPDPDFNGADQFGLKVTDTGDGAAVARDSAELLVPVSVAAVNDAPSFVAGADVVVAEDAAAQTVAGWATAISAGPANESGQALAFQVSNDNSGLFSVQPAVSAAGVLSFTPAANANGQALVSVALRDDGGTGNGGVDSSPTRTFTITVTPVNDLPVAADGSGSVAEDAASLSVDLRGLVADVETADANLSYVIVGGPAAAAGALSATGTNGVFSFVPAADFNGSASFTYRVSDRGDPDNCVAGPGCSAALASAVRTFTITVTPVNDLPVAADGADTVAEDAASLSVDLRALVADAETADANLVYAVVSGPAVGAGTLTATGTNGVFSFVPAADFNGSASFTYSVTDRGDPDNCAPAGPACDVARTSAVKTFTITVTPVNDAPAITSNGGGPTAAVSVPEGTTSVTDVNAIDPDAGTTLTYSIAGGADAGAFVIDGASGVLSFLTAPNFEAPGDANGDNVYLVNVSVSDGALADTQDLTVTVLDVLVENQAPAIISNGGGPTASVPVVENTTAVTDVDATDPDPGTTLTYTLAGGADAGRFQIDGGTGMLTFTTAPDFEAPVDANGDNVYEVIVSASDGSLSATQALSVVVGDSLETPANLPPVITSAGAGDSAEIQTDEGATPVGTVTASDPEGAPVAYAIRGGADAALFSLDPVSGALAFLSAPDYESPADRDLNNAYEVVVEASDGSLTDVQALVVRVRNVNESPTSLLPSGLVTDEDVALVLRAADGRALTVADPDGPGGTVRVTLSVTSGTLTLPRRDGLAFAVGDGTADRSLTFTGSIADVNSALDGLTFTPLANAHGIVTLVLVSADPSATSLSDTSSTTVLVRPVNDPPALATIGRVEAVAGTAVVFRAAASDVDGPELTYSLVGAPAGARIDPTTGAFSWTPTAAQAARSYSFDVVVSDGGRPERNDRVTITIVVAEPFAPTAGPASTPAPGKDGTSQPGAQQPGAPAARRGSGRAYAGRTAAPGGPRRSRPDDPTHERGDRRARERRHPRR